MTKYLIILAMLFPVLGSAQDIPKTLPAKKISVPEPATEPIKIQFPVEKYTLENGLTVLLAEDRSVPMVSFHTWYRVGSRDEKEGVTGAAHMFEHMMFKGSKKYSGKDFDRILHENGIVNNAFTTSDYTGYYENLPSSKLELMMDVEVDRMTNLNLHAEDLKSELQVVGEERRWRVDNNPMGLLREMTMSLLYTKHPYSWPVIGWMNDIQAYTVEKLRPFYEQYYVPNNAVLVLSGDFDSAAAKKMIQKYYGPLAKKDLPERKFPRDEPLTSPKFKSLKWEVASPSVVVAFQGVEAGHPDSYALDMAASIIGGGKSSRLYKRLVYNAQTASSVSAFNATPIDPGYFGIFTTMKPGQSWKLAEEATLAEVEKLRISLVSEKELEKVKNQILMDSIEGLTTLDGKAQGLAQNEITFGNYERLFTDIEKYRLVKAQDIQRVAKKYLKANARVTAVLEPK